jgi:hypothetical protein
MPRSVDVQFDANEKLWRRVEAKSVFADGRLKPSALRLQVSVVRERHGDVNSVRHGKWNGVYEVTAQNVVAGDDSIIDVSCVDDPNEQEPGHALLAFNCVPGAVVNGEEVEARRVILANNFTVLQAPIKP